MSSTCEALEQEKSKEKSPAMPNKYGTYLFSATV